MIFVLVIDPKMFSSFSKFISRPRLSLSLIKQQYLFASTSSSRSTGDTYENDKKDIHKPKIDASHQSGTKSEQERTIWENKEQGFSSDVQTRQERIPPDEKKNMKTKTSNK
jgi:hypothetical protein